METEERKCYTTTVRTAAASVDSYTELGSKHNKTCLTRRHSHFSTKCLMVLVLVTMLFADEVMSMPRSLLCDPTARCLHGGRLRLPDTPFGFCRCVCRRNYVGPRCQFNGRIRRTNRLKRLVRIRNSFHALMNRRTRTTRIRRHET